MDVIPEHAARERGDFCESVVTMPILDSKWIDDVNVLVSLVSALSLLQGPRNPTMPSPMQPPVTTSPLLLFKNQKEELLGTGLRKG